jgi:hypothetical protein
VQTLAVGGLGGVGVRSGVDELVAVGRASTEEAAFHLGLGGHRGADPDPDPVSLALGDTAEHRRDQIVGFVVGIDRTADLRHP